MRVGQEGQPPPQIFPGTGKKEFNLMFEPGTFSPARVCDLVINEQGLVGDPDALRYVQECLESMQGVTEGARVVRDDQGRPVEVVISDSPENQVEIVNVRLVDAAPNLMAAVDQKGSEGRTDWLGWTGLVGGIVGVAVLANLANRAGRGLERRRIESRRAGKMEEDKKDGREEVDLIAARVDELRDKYRVPVGNEVKSSPRISSRTDLGSESDAADFDRGVREARKGLIANTLVETFGLVSRVRCDTPEGEQMRLKTLREIHRALPRYGVDSNTRELLARSLFGNDFRD